MWEHLNFWKKTVDITQGAINTQLLLKLVRKEKNHKAIPMFDDEEESTNKGKVKYSIVPQATWGQTVKYHSPKPKGIDF